MNILASKIHSKMHYVEKNIFFERLIFFLETQIFIFIFKIWHKEIRHFFASHKTVKQKK